MNRDEVWKIAATEFAKKQEAGLFNDLEASFYDIPDFYTLHVRQLRTAWKVNKGDGAAVLEAAVVAQLGKQFLIHHYRAVPNTEKFVESLIDNERGIQETTDRHTGFPEKRSVPWEILSCFAKSEEILMSWCPPQEGDLLPVVELMAMAVRMVENHGEKIGTDHSSPPIPTHGLSQEAAFALIFKQPGQGFDRARTNVFFELVEVQSKIQKAEEALVRFSTQENPVPALIQIAKVAAGAMDAIGRLDGKSQSEVQAEIIATRKEQDKFVQQREFQTVHSPEAEILLLTHYGELAYSEEQGRKYLPTMAAIATRALEHFGALIPDQIDQDKGKELIVGSRAPALPSTEADRPKEGPQQQL